MEWIKLQFCYREFFLCSQLHIPFASFGLSRSCYSQDRQIVKVRLGFLKETATTLKRQLPKVERQKGIARIEAIAGSLRLLWTFRAFRDFARSNKKNESGIKALSFLWLARALIQRILFNITIYLFVRQSDSFRPALPLTLCCLRINTLWTTRCV